MNRERESALGEGGGEGGARIANFLSCNLGLLSLEVSNLTACSSHTLSFHTTSKESWGCEGS